MLRDTPIYAESWNIAFRKKSDGGILKDTHTPFTVIKNNFRYWAADPFVFERGGKTYVFAELYDYVLRRGILGYCTIADGKAGKWIPLIREDYHLSYPCLFEMDEKLYLMPESGSGEVLTVYEAVEFPDKWQKRKVLRSDVRLADTTPFMYAGRHLALAHQVDDPENPRLTLIDLKGNLADQVIEGREPLRSRPAGHFFENDGQWVRPSQISLDTNTGYGKGLVFCRGHIGDDLWYRENEIMEIYPKDLTYDRSIYLDGMHTYNASEHYEVIDIKTRRFNILNFIMRFAGKLLRR